MAGIIYRKYLAVFCCCVVLACLLVFQVNLPVVPPGGRGRSARSHRIETDRHSHSHVNFLDYDFFSYGLFIPSGGMTTEVPRNILGREVRYLMNNPICDVKPPLGEGEEEIVLLVLVTSYVGDGKLRRKMRQMVTHEELEGIRVKRLFLLAKPPPRGEGEIVNMKEILEENGKYQDILMGDFTESYKHLTYKHLMGLEWAATFCQNAKYVLKQDSDILVDYYQLVQMLTSGQIKLSDRQIYGKILKEQRVEREPSSKWYIPPNEYSPSVFPPYVSGWAYLTSIPAIQEILKASAATESNYIFVDDAFVTGILREGTGVVLEEMEEYFTQYKGQLLCCVSVPMFARSRNNEPFWCDYLVGPSNGDEELMEIFWRHSQYCHVSKQCRRRMEGELLRRKCVITGNMKIQDFTTLQAAGQGKAKPVIRKQ